MNVSFSDFPYLEDYYEYIIQEIIELFKDTSSDSPKLIIKDTPYLESHFIESNEGSTIILDISVHLLLIELNKALLYGKISKGLWLKLLSASSMELLKQDYPNPALSFALNKSWELRDIHFRDDNCIVNLKNDFYGEWNDQENSDIYCQEMFILAHEVTHYFINKGLFDLKKVPRTIFDDLIKDSGSDLSNKIFFGTLFGKIPEKDDSRKEFFSAARKEFFSESFRKEVLCDLNAAEITIEYFTWDGANMPHKTVCTSIQTTMLSILIASLLKSQTRSLLREETDLIGIQVFIRMKIMDVFVSKIMGRHNSSRLLDKYSFIKSKFEYDVIHSENIRKRTTAIEILFEDMFCTLSKLESVSNQFFIPHFENPKDSALYFLGYNSRNTQSEKFINSDGTLFIQKEGLMDELYKIGKVDLYKIKESSRKEIEGILASTFI
ncbi:hypothetical protein GMMP1_1570001 [Candidatus Magnetomoraceae bacterium gMMP-1]